MTITTPKATGTPRPWQTGILAGMASYVDGGAVCDLIEPFHDYPPDFYHSSMTASPVDHAKRAAFGCL